MMTFEKLHTYKVIDFFTFLNTALHYILSKLLMFPANFHDLRKLVGLGQHSKLK